MLDVLIQENELGSKKETIATIKTSNAKYLSMKCKILSNILF